MPPSTRWCPTPEQLMILEELYRRGLKTPNSCQIQKITSHLSLYGKIQGKNVFYWFQNHKARDRQKMRKMMMTMQQQQHMSSYYHHHHQQQQAHEFHKSFNEELLRPTNYYIQPQQRITAAAAAGGLLMRPTCWRSSDLLHKDYILNGNNNNNVIITKACDDSVIANYVEVGPATNHSGGPLQTLDLFPLTSSKHPNANNNTVS